MCLAEALLRIPDAATRDALIRDKIGAGDWRAHLGDSPSLFVNAATWGLLLTGRLVGDDQRADARRRADPADRARRRAGHPRRRRRRHAPDGRAVRHRPDHRRGARNASREREARGFRYSYDMLGEAATTAERRRALPRRLRARHPRHRRAPRTGAASTRGRASRSSSRRCIRAISAASASACMSELLPRLKQLAALAQRYDIGLNIDAEEADRLDLSLDLLEALCRDPELAGWNGLGFVVQAYQKRCVFVDRLARRPRAPRAAAADGAAGQGRLLGQRDQARPGRRARRLSRSSPARSTPTSPISPAPASCSPRRTRSFRNSPPTTRRRSPPIHADGRRRTSIAGQYEFQCLHGMGEPLYEEVVGRDKLDRPCRIYAPVGSHETLLAYLVRRLLENGANTSFVNRIADASVPIDELVADPVAARAGDRSRSARRTDRIALPRDLYGAQRAQLARARLLATSGASPRSPTGSKQSAQSASARLSAGRGAGRAGRAGAQPRRSRRRRRPCVVDAARRRDRRCDRRRRGGRAGLGGDAAERARGDPAPRRRRGSKRKADELVGLIVREAGKTCANAVARSARGGRFPALLRGRGGRGRSAPARPRRSASSSASARGTFRWRSSPARSPRALAAGNAVDRQAGRGDAADRRRGGARCCTRRACRADALPLLPGDGRGRRGARRAIRACAASSSPARRRSRG